MKKRYKVLFIDIIATFILYLIVQLIHIYKNSQGYTFYEAIESLLYLIVYAHQYLWINTIWLAIITIGVFKKDKELILGGIHSVIFSCGLIYFLFGS